MAETYKTSGVPGVWHQQLGHLIPFSTIRSIDMAPSLSSLSVFLFVLLSVCALPGLALAQSETSGACTALADKKSCNKQSNCCWMGKKKPGQGLVHSCAFYDLATDPLNCGTCQKRCDWPSYPSLGNPSPCCNGICTSFDVDSNNCGKCGNKCMDGAICRYGACKCPTGQCWSGTRCSIVTVWDEVGNTLVPNFDNDVDNCGACGSQCAMGSACCTGTCTTVASDSSNCGKCGHQCLDNTICVKGVCTSPCTGDTSSVNGACGCATAGTSLCGMDKCVNKLTDVLNCGACENQCPSGSSCCDGSCTNTASDVNNCGVCGRQCMGRTGSACVGGVQCMSCKDGGCSLYIPARFSNYDWSTFYELPEVGLGYIQFTAHATLDVHLALSQEARTIAPWYEIIIGGNENRESQIVHIHESGPDRADYYFGVSMDNPGGLNDLWVSIDKNRATVEAGKGVRGSANSQTIMSFADPEFLTNIRFIGFSTWTMPVTYTNMVVHSL